ncbi:MAG: glycosyltransferase [Verrucomicrobiota bacterium]
MSHISTFIWIFYGVLCSLLFVYGLNHYVLIRLFIRRRKQALQDDAEREKNVLNQLNSGERVWPLVLTQLPLYNELNVAERIIRSAAAMEYPEGKHRIQVLDDSTDETREIVDRVVSELAAEGIDISVVRRPTREGFKAGALKFGLEQDDAPYIAIFDSDFVPTRNFLKRSIPQIISQDEVGLVQARWGHLNREESWLTRALAMGIDCHFVVEQSARSWNRLYLNFNGTAGVWRRRAIEDAGGWQADTLTEDMDLSYRAQLQGWRLHYLLDLVVPAELPSTFTALKSQQFRWAKGSIQTALKILPQLKLDPQKSWIKRFQAVCHLTHYAIHFCMFLMALVSLPMVLVQEIDLGPLFWPLALGPIIAASLGPSLSCIFSQVAFDPKRFSYALSQLPSLLLVGFGISYSNARAVWEGLTGKQSAFVRTPKRGSNTQKSYKLKRSLGPWIETALGAYCLLAFTLSLTTDRLNVGIFALIYVCAYWLVGIKSLRESHA